MPGSLGSHINMLIDFESEHLLSIDPQGKGQLKEAGVQYAEHIGIFVQLCIYMI